MTINDEYGDARPVEEQALADWDAWLRRAALRMMPLADPRFADTVQEGRIEFWRAYASLADEPADNQLRFSLHRARRRMSHYAFRDEPQTGHTRMIGRPEVKPVTSLDRPLSADSETTFGALLVDGSATLDGIELAYHHGQISEAIDSLPAHHRAYVVQRFWHGLSDTEIAAREGLSSSKVLYNRWTRTIRPLLAERLAHLAL